MKTIHLIKAPECSFDSLGAYRIVQHSFYRNIGIIGRALLRLELRFRKYIPKRYLNLDFLETLQDGDVLIMFDQTNIKMLTERIDSLGINLRKILFFWNSIRNTNFAFINRAEWEIWTFDPEDALKYDLKYGGQFSLLDKANYPKGNQNKYDIYFAGIDKGRFKHLRQIESTNPGLTLFFRYVSNMKALFNKQYSSKISYSQYLKEESESTALLEYIQTGQTGLTLRTIEALFMNKKLLTTNSGIINYSFYSDDNIRIIENDCISDIYDFINSDSSLGKDVNLEDYTYFNWMQRMISSTEFYDYKPKLQYTNERRSDK